MSRILLYDEPPIAITPALVRALGSYSLAAFAQQCHYIAESHRGKEHDGHRWAVLTTEEWADELALSPKQIKTIIGTLTDSGVLVTVQVGKYDRTGWRRIDPTAIDPNGTEGRLASVPAGTDQLCLDGTDQSVPAGTDVPTKRTKKGREKPLAADAAEGLTSGQIAHRIQRDFWEFVQGRTGRFPVGISVVAFKGLLVPFLDAGVPPATLAKAVRTRYESGLSFTRQGIEQTLDGRGGKAARAQNATMDKLRGTTFDNDGNLVG